MGAADVVPGVSGGTIALVLGIYQKLIDTIRAGARALGALVKLDLRGFWEQFKALDFLFIVPLLAGIGISFVGLASVIETQLHDNPENMAGLFFGLVAASIAVALSLFKERVPQHYGIMAVVAVAVFALLGYQSGPIADPSPFVFLGAGALAICAMILPGISGSFILLMIGMYAAMIHAVKEFEIADIALVGIGCVIGLALFSSVLGWVMERAYDTVMAVLVGLMLGSLRVLWPWPNGVGVISEEEKEVIDGTGLEWPAEAGDWVGPSVLAVIAVVVVLAIAEVGKRYSTD
jgi:putative membrane protein